MTDKPLSGPLRVWWAVALAELGKTHKAVLLALGLYLDWTTWTGYPSVPTIAANCGYGERAVQTALRQLADLRVIVYERQSRGGRTHLLRLDLIALEGLANPARAAGLKPAQDATEPRTPHPATPHPTTPNPARGAHEQTIEQTKEQTTTTTASGDGGGDVVRAGWEEMMIAAGMNHADAARLAALPRMTADLLAFAIERADEAEPKHRGRYISALLGRLPGELDGFDRFRAERFSKRQYQYAELLRHAKKRAGGPDGDAVKRDAELIRAAWPTGPDLANSGVIDDADLFAPVPDWAELFHRLAVSARIKGGGEKSGDSIGVSG